jgi:3-oxoacyl-[acyl-carrier protein] reductase
VAVVTGASRGIGRAAALRLVADGAAVALLARSQERLEEVAQEISQSCPEGRTLVLPSNICSADDVRQAVDAARQEFGRIDILVNNAGITRDNLLLRMSEEEWDSVMETNLKGLFLVSKAVAKHMVRSRAGSIINISSIVGLVGNAGQANYAASKGGVIAFSHSLAKELASRGIRVNAVAPGFIETDMTAALPAEARDSYVKKIPLGRLGNIEDIAEIVAFLSGPGSSYITGEVFRVDGGLAIG